jgi:hypothetical protein
MKDYTLTPHKLEDPVVLESIESLNRLKKDKGLEGFVCGGMAVSSYLPIGHHRETVDLDFDLLWNGSFSDFKEICSPLENYFENKGYEVNYRKKGFTYDILVRSNEDSFMVQHRRRSKKNFEKNFKTLVREWQNSRTLSKDGLSYNVLSPEDLVWHKVSRVITFSNQFGLDLPEIGCSMADMEKKIFKLKNKVIAGGDESSESNFRLRILFDLYDIRSLANYTGLNNHYFWSIAEKEANSKNGVNFDSITNLMVSHCISV